MKKKYFIFAVFFILLCLAVYCLLNPNFGIFAVKNPYEMKINGKIISYYDKEEDIDADLVESIYDWSIILHRNENVVYVNDNGEIRYLFSDDKKINTYKNIHVGDEVNKIQNSFKSPYRLGSSDLSCTYIVAFDDKNNEIDTESQGFYNVYIRISYVIEDNKIEYIIIDDVNPPSKAKKSNQ